MSKSFSKLSESEEGTVLIIDSLNLAFRYKHKKELFFKEDYVRTIESLKKSYKASQVIILADHGASKFRKSIYPDYKQNRKDLQDQQSDEDREYFKQFIEEFLRIIEYFQTETSYPTFRFREVEADDVAAHIVANKDKYGFKKVWLISSDKDWDLLVQPGVSRFSYVTRKEVTYDNWNEHYDCDREDYISIKCLMGDSGDNVPGVYKVGPVTALKLVKQYGSALDIAASLPLPGKYVYIKNLNEFGQDNLIRNYQLMDLVTFCDDAIGQENIKEIESVLAI